jgi:hypothetical protein
MPEIRYYVVTQTREVKVQANSHRDAIDIAHDAFENGQDANGHLITKQSECWGDTESKIRTVEVNCKREA